MIIRNYIPVIFSFLDYGLELSVLSKQLTYISWPTNLLNEFCNITAMTPQFILQMSVEMTYQKPYKIEENINGI